MGLLPLRMQCVMQVHLKFDDCPGPLFLLCNGWRDRIQPHRPVLGGGLVLHLDPCLDPITDRATQGAGTLSAAGRGPLPTGSSHRAQRSPVGWADDRETARGPVTDRSARTYIPHIGKGICPQFPALGGSCQRSARYWASGTPRSWSIWICRGLKLGSKTRTAVLEANKV